MFETSRGTNFMQRRQGAKPKDFSGKAVVSYFIHCAFVGTWLFRRRLLRRDPWLKKVFPDADTGIHDTNLP
jgi:hypothetical protein